MWGYGDFNTRAERNLSDVRPAKNWWENCQVWAKSSWAYVDEDYKPNSQIIEQFARVRAWNGNFLLNVGPMATGELPPVAYQRMQEFGNWIHENQEAVFGTSDLPDSEHANVPATARAAGSPMLRICSTNCDPISAPNCRPVAICSAIWGVAPSEAWPASVE